MLDTSEDLATTAVASAALDEDLKQFDEMLLSKKKKKKKKRTKTSTIEESTLGATASTPHTGTGLPWDGTDRDYTYTEMLERVFSIIQDKNPNAAEKKVIRLPPPLVPRVGSKKVMWSNFPETCSILHRSQEHVKDFFMAELATNGSLDGDKRLVIKGRYMPKQIESLLKRYILEYVTCSMCRSSDTTLTRDPVSRLYFVSCSSCNARRSVAPIKSGFHATLRADRKAAKAKAV